MNNGPISGFSDRVLVPYTVAAQPNRPRRPMRNSNIELLRIVSMVLIAMFHFSVHGAWPEGGPLSSDTAVEMLSFGGKLGVNCFVLITGYFMVHGRLKVQSLLRVVLQTWFYSFAILAIFAIAQPDLVTPERLRKAVTPVTSGEYWFITCYLALMVASPFLNVLYRHLSDSGRRNLMVIGFVVLSAIPTITTYNPIGSDLVWFFYLYLMGGWLRDRPLWTRHGNACALAGGVLFVWASMAAIGWAQRAFGFDYVLPDYFIWQYMVPTFAASLGLFGLFAEWKMPPIRWVNTAAKGALGVYLIHDNPIMRAWLWPHLAWVYALGPAAILAVGVLSGVAVYAVGTAIDLARIRLLERPVMGWISEKLAQPLEKGNHWLADLKSSR